VLRGVVREIPGLIRHLGFGRDGFRPVTSAATGFGELEELGGVVLEEPIAEAALFPFGEVLFGDGAVVEVGGEDGFDFGDGIEPGKDGFVGLMVVETEVDFVAEVVGETSDFADASCSVHMITITITITIKILFLGKV
jgi:hypothetical protein